MTPRESQPSYWQERAQHILSLKAKDKEDRRWKTMELRLCKVKLEALR